MSISFRSDIPLYIQLSDMIKRAIVSGEYASGSRLPSIRDMAGFYSVTPNTLQRALTALEDAGIIYTERTNGKFVTGDREKIKQLREEILETQIDRLLLALKEYGYTSEEIMEKLKSKLQIKEG